MRVEGTSSTTAVKNVRAVANDLRQNQFANGDEMKKDSSQEKVANEQGKLTERALIKVIESANKDLKLYDSRLEFSIHEKTKEIMVKILDNETNEVIKEIPSEKVLDMVASMMELAGIIVDEKA